MGLRKVRVFKAIGLFAASVLFPSVFAMGTKDGGGGKGVLCGNKVETLDLWEARHKGIRIASSAGSLEDNIIKFGTSMMVTGSCSSAEYRFKKDGGGKWLLKEYNEKRFFSGVSDIPYGETLPATADATITTQQLNEMASEGCSLVQVIIKSEVDYTMKRDLNLWNKMDLVNQVAMMIHEYLYDKNIYNLTSDQVRLRIGFVFSDVDLLPSKFCGEKTLICGNGSDLYTAINMFKDGKAGVAFYFDKINGIDLYSETEAFYPGINLTDLMKGKFKRLDIVVKNATIPQQWSFKIIPKILPSNEVLPDWPGKFYSDWFPEPSVTPLYGQLSGGCVANYDFRNEKN